MNTYSYAAAEVVVPHVLGSFWEWLRKVSGWDTLAEHGEQPYWMGITLAAMLGQLGLSFLRHGRPARHRRRPKTGTGTLIQCWHSDQPR